MDNTFNIYRLTKEEHKLSGKVITSKYKKKNTKTKDKVKKRREKNLKNIEVLQRFYINKEINCFLILKDNKENFQSNPKIKFINPAKNEIGRISKVILDKIKSSRI